MALESAAVYYPGNYGEQIACSSDTCSISGGNGDPYYGYNGGQYGGYNTGYNPGYYYGNGFVRRYGH